MATKSKSEEARSRRERADAIRAAQKRKQRSLTLVTGTVVAVVVVVLGLLVAKSISDEPQADPSETSGLASSAVVDAIEKVPTSVFDSVGTGTAANPPKKIAGEPLTADGKPRVLYVGSEYCPFCAAERWGLTVALSRFGSFTGLGQTASDPSDVDPNTNTLSFHGATYTSTYLSFTGYEEEDRTRSKTLDTLSSADQATTAKYNSSGSIPFVDVAGSYTSSGASYDPALLAGMSHAEIAKALSDPSSAAGKAIIGTANQFTAALCKVTGNQPANVCTSAGVTAAAGQLG
ncbi:MAG: hypothetical protein JWQ74_2187 [Marmoricola sp.]|nr:hypothetical protein [Marmoricola sp.]